MTDDRDKAVHAALVRLLTALEVNQKDPNFKDTPDRVTRWLLEKFPSEETKQVQRAALAKTAFPSEYHGVVAQTGIRVYGLCPHHFKDVIFDVSLGYLPNSKIIGLSKLARLAEIELGICGTQEDLTHNLALSLCTMLSTNDIAVVVTGVHNCMVSRGAKQQGSRTTTSEMWGKFRTGIKNEFLQLIERMSK